MWRRIVPSHLKTLAADVTAYSYRRSIAATAKPVGLYLSGNRSAISASSFVISRHFSSESETPAKKKVEDVMPIATGHEKEELQAELEGRRLLDIDFPEGPFGTKAFASVSQNGMMRYSSTVPSDSETHDDFKPTHKFPSGSTDSINDIIENDVKDNPVMICMKGVPVLNLLSVGLAH